MKGPIFRSITTKQRAKVLEEEVDSKILAANFDGVLAADECEADSEFHEKFPHVFEKASFEFLLASFGEERKESKL